MVEDSGDGAQVEVSAVGRDDALAATSASNEQAMYILVCFPLASKLGACR